MQSDGQSDWVHPVWKRDKRRPKLSVPGHRHFAGKEGVLLGRKKEMTLVRLSVTFLTFFWGIDIVDFSIVCGISWTTRNMTTIFVQVAILHRDKEYERGEWVEQQLTHDTNRPGHRRRYTKYPPFDILTGSFTQPLLPKQRKHVNYNRECEARLHLQGIRSELPNEPTAPILKVLCHTNEHFLLVFGIAVQAVR